MKEWLSSYISKVTDTTVEILLQEAPPCQLWGASSLQTQGTQSISPWRWRQYILWNIIFYKKPYGIIIPCLENHLFLLCNCLAKVCITLVVILWELICRLENTVAFEAAMLQHSSFVNKFPSSCFLAYGQPPVYLLSLPGIQTQFIV
jgi:hypothetical protein